MTYDVGNPGHGLGQAHKYSWVKPVNGRPTISPLITGSPTAIQIHKQTIKIACIDSTQKDHMISHDITNMNELLWNSCSKWDIN